MRARRHTMYTCARACTYACLRRHGCNNSSLPSPLSDLRRLSTCLCVSFLVNITSSCDELLFFAAGGGLGSDDLPGGIYTFA